MTEVVQHSTQHWQNKDLLAVATYLQSLAQQHQQQHAQVESQNATPKVSRNNSNTKPSSTVLSLGAKIYEQHCEQCHQAKVKVCQAPTLPWPTTGPCC
jgi:cytochrome c5